MRLFLAPQFAGHCLGVAIVLMLHAMVPVAGHADVFVETVPGVTGHQRFITHDYSMPIIVDGQDVYAAYMDNDAVTSSYVVKYTGATGQWSAPFHLGGGVTNDAHYYPNIVMDHDGYIHAFYGCHGHPIRYRRTVNPRDISQWTSYVGIGSQATYPRPFVLEDGRILVFHRSRQTILGNDWRYGYIESSNGGATWSAFRILINVPSNAWVPYVGGVYIDESAPSDPVAHIGWCWYSVGTSPIRYDDVMHAAFPLGTNQWRDAAGNMFALPATHSTVAPIERMFFRFVQDVSVDPDGRPVVLFHAYHGSVRSARTATFKSGQWVIEEPAPGESISLGSIRLARTDDWLATVGFSSTQPGRGVYMAQRHRGTEQFIRRQVAPHGAFPPYVFSPAIIPDNTGSSFHLIWGFGNLTDPAALMHATVMALPPGFVPPAFVESDFLSME